LLSTVKVAAKLDSALFRCFNTNSIIVVVVSVSSQ